MKNNKLFECNNCGAQYTKWAGQCDECNNWGTIEEAVAISTTSTSKPIRSQRLDKVNREDLKRVSAGFSEFDRVLGGTGKKYGLALGSVNLISGDPGIGKSTLLLQVAKNISQNNKVLYVSAEESINQIGLRADRLGATKDLMNVEFINDYDTESVLDAGLKINPGFMVIDSIQTLHSSDASGLPGGLSQVKTNASKLVQFAKKNNITMFIIGHINKDGNVAGPKILEHLVDAVFQLEGEKTTDLRLLRSLKNRFGATNEVGVFKMEGEGLVDVENPAEYFLTSDNIPGVARGAALEGNRTLIVEVQSLLAPSIYSLPKRVAEGISNSRLQLICAILQRYLKLNLSDKDVYVSLAGGFKVNERALDMAIAHSIVSSYKNKPVKGKNVYIGEISLTGNTARSVSESIRIKEVERLGYKTVNTDKLSHISQIKL